MIATALALALLAVQDPPPAAPVAVPAQAVYAPPPIRPFEPPSDFGRAAPEGDGDPAERPHRAPIVAPVTVEAYGGQYEAEPGSNEAAYAQGVAAAEIRMDALAGPLDGRWSVIDASGRPLLRLVLADPGAGLPLEGAWRVEGGPGAGAATSARREDGSIDLLLLDGGTLSLTLGPDGWSGVLVGADGRERRVRLVR